jgi:CRP-like cAMP-binding protein
MADQLKAIPASVDPRSVFAPFCDLNGLNDPENRLLSQSTLQRIAFRPGHQIAEPHDGVVKPRFILSGWVALARLLDDGRRQLIDLQLPGDLTTFEWHRAAAAKGTYVCLTAVQCAEIGTLVEQILSRPSVFPTLMAALHTANDAMHTRLCDQVVRVGRLSSLERIADLAIELSLRHERFTGHRSNDFPMPLTQETLGDLLGMSTVHVNRTLQQLRRDGLLQGTPGLWQMSNRKELEALASGAHTKSIHFARQM